MQPESPISLEARAILFGGLEQSNIQSTIFDVRTLPSPWDIKDRSVVWCVDELVAEGGVTMVSGPAGSGKSLVVLAICGAVVHGQPFCGYSVRRRPVLYLDSENPASSIRERLDLLGIERTPDLHYWGGWHDPGPHGPASPSVVQFARDTRGLIVCDSLIAFLEGDEQSATEVRRFMQGFRQLASIGASVICIHHSGKGENAKAYRGSSDFAAAIDVGFTLEVEEGERPEGREFRLRGFKNRFRTSKTISVRFVGGRFSVSGLSSPTNQQLVKQVIREYPGSTLRQTIELAAKHGVTKQRAIDLVNIGEQEGWVIVEKGPRGARKLSLASDELERTET